MFRPRSSERAITVVFWGALLVLSPTVVFGKDVLPPCRRDLPYYVWDHCRGAITYSGKESAVGEFMNGKLNGQGTFMSPAGLRYVGEFKDDLFNGQGSLRYSGGGKYVGEFKDGEKNGQGTETLPDGSNYVGAFAAGKRSGQGAYTIRNGDVYVGEFKVGKLEGKGTYTYANGGKLVGEFNNGAANGQGTLTFPNGYKYVGQFKDGKQSGQGTQTFANAKQDGQGIQIPGSMERYVGEFEDGKPSGQGNVTFFNGDQYVGAMRDGRRNGRGTLMFANGDKYVGEFKDAKQDGQGTLFAANQSILSSGIWADGKFLGAAADQETIAMEKSGGVYIVSIRLNDIITLNAIVDSGASDLSMPADVVSTLIRTKTIMDEDFLGQQTYMLADGSKVPSPQLRIRSLRVGNKTIENVVASIVSAKGEILLGQSFLTKFKSWSVDNEQHTLVLR
jgi:hypothetical protein